MAAEQPAYLQVRMSKATEVLWEGLASSVSSENAQGTFDILPMHANFISLIRDKPIVVVTDKAERLEYLFPVSVMYVHENVVKIYTDMTHISS
jgi:F0F1-type ATP synthase epsilon subunit